MWVSWMRSFRTVNWRQREARRRLPGALGNSTLLCKNLLHSCLEVGFDKLINLSFLLPKHSCHSKPSCTPKRCLFQMQNFSVFWCGRLLFPGSRTRDAGNSTSSEGMLLQVEGAGSAHCTVQSSHQVTSEKMSVYDSRGSLSCGSQRRAPFAWG